MKKYIPFLLIIVLFSLIFVVHGCPGSKNSTTSYVKVLNKNFSKKDQYWIIAVNPYDTKLQPFKITIDSMNTWNLIKENEIYLASYEILSDGNAKIQSIKYPADTTK
ncbi:hypothetical protein RJP21_18705 [Paenibacillus sp. VCA1]|uniref:hypothetical protein n=1 Tax=Paenibacillus sp. VCA1 TaxID=3039148 RepID=UPI00287269AC|nr:hypothetical protein [Paenibacillus sp. VCA1]MDR9855647.1 hypothetical protein [Paenibacillus sp. VCA1]